MMRTMASSSASPSSKPADDDGFDLEELVSEILALRNLYGLLQKNTDQTSTNHLMDEKSRDLLKKLLDGATLRALRSQTKIISATPETPKTLPEPDTANPSHVGLLNNAEQAAEGCRQSHPATPPASEAAEATEKIFSRAEEPGVTQNPLPVCKDDDSTRRDPVSRPSVPQSRRKSSEPSKNPIRRAKDEKSGSVRALADRRSSGAPSSSEKGGEHQALVPAQKRARVDLPSRTRKPGRLDRELTHQKGASTATMAKSSESNGIKLLQRTRSSRSVMLAGDQTVRVVQQRDQSAECKSRTSKHFERAVSKSDQKLLKQSEPACTQRNRLPPNRLKARRYYYSSSSNCETTQSNSASSRSTTSRSPAESGPVTPTKHRRVKRSKRAAAPQCTTSRGAINKREKAPQRMPSHPSSSAALVPSRRPPSRQRRAVKAPKTEAEKEGEGRLRRFMKNKLAIIFHHHHHHHLHAGENEDGGNSRNRKEHERSLWKYLKTLLHIRSESGEEQGMLAARGQHGYWHAMLEGLLRHIWGIRRRRAEKRRLGKAANRRGSKKLRWWHWFRRRGGVALGNRRRLRLGFNRSSRRRTAAGKR